MHALVVFVTLFAQVYSYRWHNWQFDLTCTSGRLFAPWNESDLAAFMRREYDNHSMIKVVGNGHCFGNMTRCVDQSMTNRDTFIVKLDNLLDFRVGKNNTVTFGAGWSLLDLVTKLRQHNLSLANLGSERVQNYVGAAVTGTHGTGKLLKNVAASILAVRLMTAAGFVLTISETENAHMLPAVRVSLGALGLITQVTMQATPLGYLKRTTKVLTAPTGPSGETNFTLLYQMVQDLYKQHERVEVWGPQMIWNNNTRTWDIQSTMMATIFEPTNVKNVFNCSTNYCANGCGDCILDSHCYDYDVESLATPPAGVCNRFFYTEIEHFMPVEHMVEAFTEYTIMANNGAREVQQVNNHQMIYELRFVRGDQNYMSPANTFNLDLSSSTPSSAPKYSGVFAVIEIDWYMTYNNFTSLWIYQELAKRFLPVFGRKYNVRPHWGKMSWFDLDYARYAYPRVDEFLALRRLVDPHCQFVNEFLVHHFGLQEECKTVFASSSSAASSSSTSCTSDPNGCSAPQPTPLRQEARPEDH